ncbi:phosphoglycerate dehydrogenase [Haladaptatus sp. F3-133]|uniref:Phosphoglycerate dehydrogenase n=1 Tax=Halorutilus salinus TaxID=2487751 RepID=A0A9Q4C431_9EURY|nr:phosphoglycerate dehydrogenase [Halorutilus salinus]MCX2818620.1 phosphoglycerate dehydrogenase [Halorutilus salinus]
MTNEHRVLVSCPLMHGSVEQYEGVFEENSISADVPEVGQQLDEDELLEIIDDYHGVIAGDDEFTRKVIESAKNLKVISKWGIGTDSIDEEAARDNGVEVYNTPGAFDDEVGDVVVGYTVMLTRDLHKIDRFVREGRWECPRGTSLADKTFGVVGVGSIGEAVVRRADALCAKVLGNDVQPISDDLKRDTSVEAVEIDELLRRSDIVSLNCPLTPATEKMIGSEELEKLGGYLINTARGELVKQDELVEALRDGVLQGAALDVFKEEPLPADHPLTEMDNVILGSHNAQNTDEAVQEVNDRAVENLIEGLRE